MVGASCRERVKISVVAVSLKKKMVVAEAELLTVPQEAAVVGEVMWTWKEAAGGRSTGRKCRTADVMVQVPVVSSGWMLQPSPEWVGRVSEWVTLCAVPAPVLLTVTT